MASAWIPDSWDGPDDREMLGKHVPHWIVLLSVPHRRLPEAVHQPSTLVVRFIVTRGVCFPLPRG